MSFFEDFFYFNKPERRGLFVLLILILALGIIHNAVKRGYFSDSKTYSFDKLNNIVNELEKPQKQNSVQKNAATFYLNPNQASLKELILFGLSEEEAKVFIQQREKQPFQTADDFENLRFLSAGLIQKLKKYSKDFSKDSSQTAVPVQLFEFNPNRLSEEKWKMLGLKDWQIKIIQKYEAAGGSFKQKTDLKKIYGITEEWYQKVEPYIVIPGENVIFKIQLLVSSKNYETNNPVFRNLSPISKEQHGSLYKYFYGNFTSRQEVEKELPVVKKAGFDAAFVVAIKDNSQNIALSKTYNKPKQEKNFVIDINKADTSEFKQIRGIGSKLSARIVKYREALGGFYKIEQLSEVYGIDNLLIEKNKHHFKCENVQLKKIHINTADYKTLFSHPYISKSQASAIVNYRLQHGEYRSLKDLLKIHILSEAWFQKTEPYLDIQ
jgi:competence ComEA-like helix-hairpin-helix protein